MEFSISKKKFLHILNIANKGVAKNTTFPILENALLSVKDNGLEITTTDLDTAVRVNIRGVKVVKEGSLTLPCRSLLGIVRGLVGDTVTVTKKDDTLCADIIDGKDVYHLAGLTVDDYPDIPRYEEKGKNRVIEFEEGLLGSMIKKTIFATSTDPSRYQLKGVFFEGLDEGMLRMVSTDGYRLCRLDRQVNGDVKGFLKDGGVILPVEGLRKLEGIVKGYKGSVKMWLENGSAIFRGSDSDSIFGGDSFTVAMKIVDGNFPDYNQPIPKGKCDKRVVVDRKRMIECLKRVKTVSGIVEFKLSDGRLDMSGEGEDRENKAEIGMGVDYGGEDMEVKFKICYWLDFLNSVDETNVEIEIFDPPYRVYVVRPKVDRDYMGVIMPRVEV